MFASDQSPAASTIEGWRDAEKWIHRVAGSELHRLYGHTSPYPTCGDSMCLRARKYREFADGGSVPRGD